MQRLTTKLFGAVAAGLMMLLLAAPGSAQVAVSIAGSVEGETGETGAVGVFVGSLDGEDVLAYDFTVEFDADVLDITGVNAEGTISEGISINTASPTDSTFRVVAATGTALTGSGNLIWLEYEFVADGSSSLELTDFTFNEGEPAATISDVTLRLPNTGAEPDTEILIPIFVDDIDGQGVLSYDFTVTFDSDVVVFDDVETSGTLSENASVVVSAEDGSIRVVAATGTAFEGSGVLVFLSGTSDGEGETALTFTEVTLNEGDPSAAGIDGSLAVGVGLKNEAPGEMPGSFALHGNYPNPFNPSTTIRFDLPATAEVSVQIFDVLGRQVMALPVQVIEAGADQSMQIDAASLSSGSYLYRVVARTSTDTMVKSGMMTLLK